MTHVSVRSVVVARLREPVGVVPDLGVGRVDLLDGVDVGGLDGLEEALRHVQVLAHPADRTRAWISGRCDPGGDEVGDVVAGGGRLLEVVVAGEVLEALVGRGDGVEELLGLRREHAGVARRVDDERRQVQAGEVRAAAAVGVGEAPHVQPAATRRQHAEPEHAGVGLARVAAVAPRRLAVRRVERAVHHPQVGPRPRHREQPVADADGLQPVELGVAPRRDAGVAVALGGAVAGDELGVVGRPRIERVERRVA